jgi:large subunit ribosomal protein L24
MKLKVGDKVIITAGKDKGKKSEVIAINALNQTVTVKDVNMYVKHIKPFNGRPGEKTRKERALPSANVAILNDKDQSDRIGYIVAKDKTKVRIFKKTGNPVPELNDKKSKK